MIQIFKGSEPRELVEHRLSQHSTYDNLNKEPVRKSLLAEQRYICAYCMDSINENNSQIEHFVPQSVDESLALTYSNFLAVCKGVTKNEQHCDVVRGNKHLDFNPSDASKPFEAFIFYSSKGVISSENPLFLAQISTLNLNHKQLQRNREAALKVVLDFIKKNNPKSKATREKVLLKYSSKNNLLPPFAGIVRFFIQKNCASGKPINFKLTKT